LFCAGTGPAEPLRPCRALLILSLALALAGCNGTLPLARLAPFRVIGDWTGNQWRSIGPTLGGELDPASSNICDSGQTACMSAILAEMSRRIAALGCSHLAPFATMYRQVSREIKASAEARRYADPAYVVHLDAVFSTFYYHALDSWRAGRRDEVPQVWRIAFSAAGGRRVSTLGDMLLGMNAHISRDLPYALATVGLRYPDGLGATADVVAVNKDIERATQPMLAQIRAAYDPSLGPPRDLPNWVHPSEVPKIIAQWRLEAIANARDLLDAHSVAARVEVETRIDTTATLRSLLIWRATAYADPARDSAPRDAYCAAHLARRSSE
jgi:hypothetical protein